DAHVAILLGTAEVLTKMREEIAGSVKFFFQPAEEGAPQGEEGGAELMVKEGVLENVDAIFGLHVTSRFSVGQIAYQPGAALAACTRPEHARRDSRARETDGGADRCERRCKSRCHDHARISDYVERSSADRANGTDAEASGR